MGAVEVVMRMAYALAVGPTGLALGSCDFGVGHDCLRCCDVLVGGWLLLWKRVCKIMVGRWMLREVRG
jgi:hypothetical protein